MNFDIESNHVAQDNIRRQEAVLVDVREKIEFDDVALAGAVNLPLSKFDVEDYKQFKGKTIYVICFSGDRSLRVAKALLEDGVKVCLLENQMDQFIEAKDLPAINGWTIDRQFRMAMGGLLLVFLLGFGWLSTYFLVIPIILTIGLLYAAILNKCYLRKGIALLPWNSDKA